MTYRIVFSKKSTDIIDDSGTIIFKTIRKTFFFKRKYYVYDQYDNLLFAFQKSDFLLIFTKTKILINNFDKNFEYAVKGMTYILKIDGLEIRFSGKIAGYLKSEFKINERVVGFINEEYQFPNNRMSVNFLEDNAVNKFCLVLLIIATVNYWDPN